MYVSVLFQAPRSPSFLSRILLCMRKQLTDRQRMNYVFITRVWLNRTQRLIFINTLFGRTLSGAGTFLGTILIARHLCLSCSAVKWLNRRRVENSTRLTRNALHCGTVNNTSKHSHVVLLSYVTARLASGPFGADLNQMFLNFYRTWNIDDSSKSKNSFTNQLYKI